MQIFSHWNRLKNQIDQALDLGANPIAAFDADGTLWETDMGENYFQYLIDSKLVPLPKDPWKHYLDLRNGPNPPQGYLWLAQILNQVPIDQVKQWGVECVNRMPHFPFFEEQKKLIQYLKKNNVDVYIVTASVKWAVEAAAEHYDIPASQVLGVTTKIKDQRVTDVQEGPITWKQGKVEGLKIATNGLSPFLSAGNSTGDIYLLQEATHISIAVRSVPQDHMIFDSEEQLSLTAREKGWLTHDFRKMQPSDI